MPWPNDVLTRNVTGTYLTPASAPAQGRITFTPTTRIVDIDDAVVIEEAIVSVLDINGSFVVELPTTDNELLFPRGWAYEVNVRLHGVKPQHYYVFIPYGDGSAISINQELSAMFGVAGSTPLSVLQFGEAMTPLFTRGLTGPRGPGIIVDAGAPSSGQGFDGDIYVDETTGQYYGPKASGAWPAEPLFSSEQSLRIIQVFTVARSLTVGVGASRYYVHTAMVITNIRAGVGTPPAGAAVIVDINKNGTSVFTTQANRPTITVGQNTASRIPDTINLIEGDYLTVDIDQVGSSVAGSDLTVQIELAY